ncbi:MAG TPA: DUF4349 domain-containing protein [Bryobacteraceae bacterium]|jgi:anti-sigma factor RsiW
MQMKTHPFSEEEIMAYLDGELNVAEGARTAGHLKECGECRQVAADLEQVSRGLREWKAPPVRKEWQAPLVEKRKRFRWEWMAAAAALVVVLVGVRLGTKHDRVVRSVGDIPYQAQRLELAQPDMALQRQAVRDSGVVGGTGVLPPASQVVVPGAEPLIARSAELSLTAARFGSVRADIERIVRARGGYVSDLSASAAVDQAQSLRTTLLVPAAQLDQLLSDLRALGHVDSEVQHGEDVTRQSVDTDARLANLRQTEQRLTAILRDRTGKLADVLAVEEQIARIRGQIETTEAEQKALARRVAMASVQVTIAERFERKMGGDQPGISTRLRNAAVEGLQAVLHLLEGIVLFVLAYGPVLVLLFVMLFWPGRLLWKKLRANH